MAQLLKTGLLGAAQFRSYDVTPHQAIAVGRRGKDLICTAAQAGHYIYSNLSGANVCEGRQFMDIDGTQAMSVLKMVNTLGEEEKNRTALLFATANISAVDSTTRRYINLTILDWTDKSELYNLGFAVGTPVNGRLSLSINSVIALSAFDTTPDNMIVPCLGFNLQEGDDVLNWSINAVIQ